MPVKRKRVLALKPKEVHILATLVCHTHHPKAVEVLLGLLTSHALEVGYVCKKLF